MTFHFRGSNGNWALFGPKGNQVSQNFKGTRFMALTAAKAWASSWPAAVVKEEDEKG